MKHVHKAVTDFKNIDLKHFYLIIDWFVNLY